MLDEDLAKDLQVTPLARAVWRGDFELTEHLVKVFKLFFGQYIDGCQN